MAGKIQSVQYNVDQSGQTSDSEKRVAQKNIFGALSGKEGKSLVVNSSGDGIDFTDESGSGAVFLPIPQGTSIPQETLSEFYDLVKNTLDVNEQDPSPKKNVILYDPKSTPDGKSTYWILSEYDGNKMYFSSVQSGTIKRLLLEDSYSGGSGTRTVTMTKDYTGEAIRFFSYTEKNNSSPTYDYIYEYWHEGYLPALYQEQHHSRLIFQFVYHDGEEPEKPEEPDNRHFTFAAINQEGSSIRIIKRYNDKTKNTDDTYSLGGGSTKFYVSQTKEGAEEALRLIGLGQTPVLITTGALSDNVYLPFTKKETITNGAYYIFSAVLQEKDKHSHGSISSGYVTRRYAIKFTVKDGEIQGSVPWEPAIGTSKWHIVTALIDLDSGDYGNWKNANITDAINYGANLIVKKTPSNSYTRYMTLSNKIGSGTTYVFSCVARTNLGKLEYSYIINENKIDNFGWGDLDYYEIGEGGGSTLTPAGSYYRPVYVDSNGTVQPCSFGISTDAYGNEAGVLYFR